jgi:hypothetical protein
LSTSWLDMDGNSPIISSTIWYFGGTPFDSTLAGFNGNFRCYLLGKSVQLSDNRLSHLRG